MNRDILISELKSHQQVLEKTVEQKAEVIGQIAQALVKCFRAGNKLLLCGNGGSAADAQHVAGELVNRFRYDHAPLAAIALTTDTSVLTCIGNDSSFEFIFSRQVEALGKPGDILAGISTSGASADILRALETARLRGLIPIGFTGEAGEKLMLPKCDLCIAVSSTDTARIQESHIFIWHYLCDYIEQVLFPLQ